MAYPNEFHTNACMSAIKHAGINWFWLKQKKKTPHSHVRINEMRDYKGEALEKHGVRLPSSGGLGIFGFIQLGAAGIPVQIDQV